MHEVFVMRAFSAPAILMTAIPCCACIWSASINHHAKSRWTAGLHTDSEYPRHSTELCLDRHVMFGPYVRTKRAFIPKGTNPCQAYVLRESGPEEAKPDAFSAPIRQDVPVTLSARPSSQSPASITYGFDDIGIAMHDRAVRAFDHLPSSRELLAVSWSTVRSQCFTTD